MTLKPPTRTFPKLVMKDFDEEEMKVLGALADLDDRDFFATVMGDCGETHRSLKERLDCAACNHAIATNSRPWMAEDHPKALSDFTRVVDQTGILKQPTAFDAAMDETRKEDAEFWAEIERDLKP